MDERRVVIGLDGGGTTTRALCCALDGQVLAYAESGGSSVQHNALEDAARHVQTAIQDVLQQAGRELADARAVAAGLAGLDAPKDHEWAAQLTALPGLDGPRLHVNDSVVAHAGALLSQPGIIVICGTGSIIYGVNEAGRAVCNYDFNHYADAAARALTLGALHRLLAGLATEADGAFTQAVLDFWEVADIDALRQRAAAWGAQSWKEKVHHWGRMAPLVTGFALSGTPLCRRVCEDAAEQIGIGIRLLGASFTSRPVSVALIGSAARSPFMQQAVAAWLEQAEAGAYQLETPVLSSAAGAVLLALKEAGITPDETLLNRLRAHPQAAFSA